MREDRFPGPSSIGRRHGIRISRLNHGSATCDGVSSCGACRSATHDSGAERRCLGQCRSLGWADQRQVEQDLIISRALVEIFSDAMLCDALRIRGGTALNKLHFQAPLRYSEDIDLVRTSAGLIGPILDRLRVALEPWLG